MISVYQAMVIHLRILSYRWLRLEDHRLSRGLDLLVAEGARTPAITLRN